MNNDTRPFPIQADLGHSEVRGEGNSSAIPWWLAEVAYKQYAKLYGTRQTLERLAQRGGFGRAELVDLLRQHDTPEKICLCPADGVYQLCPIHRQGSPR